MASHHPASAYKPVNLTSCLGKGLERIITQRLYAFCGHIKIIDRHEERFRRFKSCTHALLRLVQDACNGFKDGESAVTVLIDLEKAYASVEGRFALYSFQYGYCWKSMSVDSCFLAIQESGLYFTGI